MFGSGGERKKDNRQTHKKIEASKEKHKKRERVNREKRYSIGRGSFN